MKIFSAAQIKTWDRITMEKESVSGLALMERAARKCFEVISEKFAGEKFTVFCGHGNNGGDGLALARMLLGNNFDTQIVLAMGREGSDDFEFNLHQIEEITDVQNINFESLPDLSNRIVIDALFGYGLNKPLKNKIEKLVKHINKSARKIISIDIPSGMFADKHSIENTIVRANLTLTFQQRKLAFFMPENAAFTGEVIVLDIGLHPQYQHTAESNFYQVDAEMINNIYQPRQLFTNKGTFGTACMIAGSHGMMGAAVMAAHGCIRSGVGKLACYTCEAGYPILQTTTPEALCKVFGKNHIESIDDFSGFDAIGIGPGIGKFDSHKSLLEKAFTALDQPMVIDADALNVLSEQKDLYQRIPANSIITPHPKEFERLFGNSKNDFAQRALALERAKELNIYIVLKGRYTFIATPNGKGYFNTTGNPGLATAGTGDVLTGVLTGLLAQHYAPLDACLLGVYLHGLSADIAVKEVSEEALVASDVYQFLGKAFLLFSL